MTIGEIIGLVVTVLLAVVGGFWGFHQYLVSKFDRLSQSIRDSVSNCELESRREREDMKTMISNNARDTALVKASQDAMKETYERDIKEVKESVKDMAKKIDEQPRQTAELLRQVLNERK